MTHSYNISGMSCVSCVGKIKTALLKIGDISEADVQLTAPQAKITMQRHVPLEKLQASVAAAGNFKIEETGYTTSTVTSTSWLETYKPILLIFAYITGITLLSGLSIGTLNWETGMRHFMAGFFLTFSFFKLLNLKAFADAYSSYDIVAREWHGWGYLYAFIELALGIAFLVNLDPLLTNGVAFVVMSISIIGVLQAVLRKTKIQCACLGAVFNLPMSTVTIIEDALMIVMSATMILMSL